MKPFSTDKNLLCRCTALLEEVDLFFLRERAIESKHERYYFARIKSRYHILGNNDY